MPSLWNGANPKRRHVPTYYCTYSSFYPFFVFVIFENIYIYIYRGRLPGAPISKLLMLGKCLKPHGARPYFQWQGIGQDTCSLCGPDFNDITYLPEHTSLAHFDTCTYR